MPSSPFRRWSFQTPSRGSPAKVDSAIDHSVSPCRTSYRRSGPPAPVSRAKTAQTTAATITTMTTLANTCSYYDEHVFVCQGSAGQGLRPSPLTPRMTTVVRRAAFASAANSTVTSTAVPPGTTSGTSRGRCTDERDHAAANAREPLRDERTGRVAPKQTFARASSPARTWTACDQPATLRTAALGSRHGRRRAATGPRDALAPGGCVGDRRAHGLGGWPGGAVQALESGLEARARAVVAEAEEAHVRDVRIARRAAHELRIDGGLRELVRDHDVLEPLVPGLAGRADLPADLVEVELQPVHRRRLRRPVEGVPQRLLDPIEVDESGVRPRVAPVEGVGRLVRDTDGS